MMQGFEKMLKAMGVDPVAIKAKAEAFASEIHSAFTRLEERIFELEARVLEVEQHLDMHAPETIEPEPPAPVLQALPSPDPLHRAEA